MKGNERNILIGAVVVALLIIFGAYNFFYSADVEKADQIEAEIQGYRARMEELNAKNANRSMYEAGITNSKDIIKTVLSLYGPGNSAEKTIMMIVDLCHKTGISVSDITFEEDRLVYASESLMEDGVTPEVQIFKGGAALNLSSGYTQLKKLTDYINSHPERMNAENFTVGFDPESGRLSVTMNVNLYAVQDENHKYIAPVVEEIELGTDNIFKTAEIVTEEELAEEEVNAGAEANEKSSEETGDKEE